MSIEMPGFSYHYTTIMYNLEMPGFSYQDHTTNPFPRESGPFYAGCTTFDDLWIVLVDGYLWGFSARIQPAKTADDQETRRAAKFDQGKFLPPEASATRWKVEASAI